MGTFYRTIRLVEQGIKPVYVFDGKPPNLKSGELAKRAERREEAQKLLQAAEEDGNDKLCFFIVNNTLKIIHYVLYKITKDFHSKYLFIKGNVEAIDKFNRRLVKVTKTHVDEAKELLQLMGIPYIDVSIYMKLQFLYLFLMDIFYVGTLRG